LRTGLLQNGPSAYFGREESASRFFPPEPQTLGRSLTALVLQGNRETDFLEEYKSNVLFAEVRLSDHEWEPCMQGRKTMNHKILLLTLAAVVSAVLCSTASAGLVGWWTFDETTGATAKDSSGQGNDGRIVGTPQWVAGKIGGALQFNGSTYVDCGNKPSLNVRNQITISFWFKVQAFVNT
jgi:hypothetical protein